MIAQEKSKNVQKMRKELLVELGVEKYYEIPSNAVPREEITNMLKKLKSGEDKKWKEGKVSGAVYFGEDDLSDFLNQVYSLYSSSNALHPDIW